MKFKRLNEKLIPVDENLKAMFANGYKEESLTEALDLSSMKNMMKNYPVKYSGKKNMYIRNKYGEYPAIRYRFKFNSWSNIQDYSQIRKDLQSIIDSKYDKIVIDTGKWEPWGQTGQEPFRYIDIYVPIEDESQNI